MINSDNFAAVVDARKHIFRLRFLRLEAGIGQHLYIRVVILLRGVHIAERINIRIRRSIIKRSGVECGQVGRELDALVKNDVGGQDGCDECCAC